MSKRPCGHDSEQSDSVYVCFPCKDENEAATRDAIWNAAIEAAAERAKDEAFVTGDVTWNTAMRIADAIRALKRGQS